MAIAIHCRARSHETEVAMVEGPHLWREHATTHLAKAITKNCHRYGCMGPILAARSSPGARAWTLQRPANTQHPALIEFWHTAGHLRDDGGRGAPPSRQACGSAEAPVYLSAFGLPRFDLEGGDSRRPERHHHGHDGSVLLVQQIREALGASKKVIKR